MNQQSIQLPRLLVGFSGNPEFTAMLDGHPFAEKVTYRSFTGGLGGTSINTSLQAGVLGMPVSTVITVGRDHLARELRDLMQDRHVHVHCRTIECREATSLAIVEIGADGTRSIRSRKTHYQHFPVEQVDEEVSRLRPSCAVATGCTAEEEPLIRALFNGVGVRVLNPRESLCENHEVFSRLLAITDILCINEGEFSAWLGHKAKEHQGEMQLLLDRGPKIVIVTRDKEGVVVANEGLYLELPAYTAGSEVDGTGAGDAFLAAFLSAYLTDFPLEEAARFATIVAGIKVTKYGGSSVATIEEIRQHYPDWSPWKFRGGRLAAELEVDQLWASR